MKAALLTVIASLSMAGAARAAQPAEVLHVYGPGGPAPAMQAAARAFGAERGVRVEVTAGPTPTWLSNAKTNADLVYSGSETMMTDFIGLMADQIDAGSVKPLYLRPSAILVRPGNPRHIHGLADLFRPGHRILVVNGAGQTGLWEDMAGRTGDLASVAGLRADIAVYAKNSAEAKAAWKSDPTLDAWIIWNIWQVANPDLAQVVSVEPQYRIYRDTAVALTRKGENNPAAAEFVDFLASSKGAAIFNHWGWVAPRERRASR